ncbi:MAG: hypothetical protein ABIV94_06905 [Acidimicrobiales bacterium]
MGGALVSVAEVGSRRGFGRLVVLIVILAAACSGSGLSPNSRLGSAIASCRPSASEAGAVVGAAVTVGVTSGSGSLTDGITTTSDGCTYRWGDAEVTVERIGSDPPGDTYARLLALAQDVGYRTPFEPLDGIGGDARLDGHAVAVHSPSAIVYVRVDLARPDGSDTADKAAAIARGTVGLALVAADGDAACGTVEPVVAASEGPISDRSRRPGDLSVGEVALRGITCRFEVATGQVVEVTVAEPKMWDRWVAAKERSGGRYRVVERTVAGRSAFETADELVVDDGDRPLSVRTIAVPGDDAALDRIREEIAAQALS